MKVIILLLYQSTQLTSFHRTATSAVDLDTDKSIQEIIRGPQFADTTMFTIAYVLDNLCNTQF